MPGVRVCAAAWSSESVMSPGVVPLVGVTVTKLLFSLTGNAPDAVKVAANGRPAVVLLT